MGVAVLHVEELKSRPWLLRFLPFAPWGREVGIFQLCVDPNRGEVRGAKTDSGCVLVKMELFSQSIPTEQLRQNACVVYRISQLNKNASL